MGPLGRITSRLANSSYGNGEAGGAGNGSVEAQELDAVVLLQLRRLDPCGTQRYCQSCSEWKGQQRDLVRIP
jgi:hypothetical protein